MKLTVRKMVVTAMLAALAYVAMFFIRIPLIPAASFLEYDPKDILLVITGFLIGPVQGLISIILVCLLQMVTVSKSGPIGLLMNVIASIFFVLPASLIYRKWKNILGAVVGLLVGIIAMTASMVLWNYWITPMYMGVPREAVKAMLPTVFVPFNLIKAGINTAVTLILYKPISKLLHASGALKDEKADKSAEEKKKQRFSPLPVILGALLLIACIASLYLMSH